MALTKSRIAVYSSETLNAGAGPTTSASQDVSDAYGSSYGIELINGATGPTTAAKVQPQVQYSGGTQWYDHQGLRVGSTDDNGVSAAGDIPIGIGVTAIRFVVTHADDQNVTLNLDIGKTTAL